MEHWKRRGNKHWLTARLHCVIYLISHRVVWNFILVILIIKILQWLSSLSYQCYSCCCKRSSHCHRKIITTAQYWQILNKVSAYAITNRSFRCEEKRGLSAKLLPKRPARVLRNTLEQLTQKLRHFMKSFAQNSARDASIDRDFQQKRKEVIFL